MNTKILNFDSCFSSYLNDSNTTGIITSPYYVQYKLAPPIRNV